jgi:hypothetical protein
MLPEAIREGVENCDTTVTSHQDNIESACEDYLTEGVSNGAPGAIWLNSASAEQAETCVSSQSCDRELIIEIIEGLLGVTTGGDASDMAVLLAPLITGCTG